MDNKYKYTFENDSEYCYPNTNILKNKLNIINDDDLYKAEMELVAYSIASLIQKPIKGEFDFEHLKSIHKRMFEKFMIELVFPENVVLPRKIYFAYHNL